MRLARVKHCGDCQQTMVRLRVRVIKVFEKIAVLFLFNPAVILLSCPGKPTHPRQRANTMQKKWHILFCDETEQACPVTEFINQCRPAHQVKMLRILSLLEDRGPILPRPYADILYDGIHELRIRLAKSQVRILYFFCHERFIVLYHVFYKTTRRVPDKYINRVIQYRDTFLEKTSRDRLERLAHAVF